MRRIVNVSRKKCRKLKENIYKTDEIADEPHASVFGQYVMFIALNFLNIFNGFSVYLLWISEKNSTLKQNNFASA